MGKCVYQMLLCVFNLFINVFKPTDYSTLVTYEGSVLIKTSHGPSFEDANRKVISTPFTKVDG